MHKPFAQRNRAVPRQRGDATAARRRRRDGTFLGHSLGRMHTISAPDCVQSAGWMCCNGSVARGAMGKLTTHVLNIAAGVPAAGMRIELRSLRDASNAPFSDSPLGAPPLSASRTNADGRCFAPLLEGAGLLAGRYSLTFHVAAYFRSLEVALPDPPFLDEVVIAFGVADPSQNYHVPLLVSPWSYSTYRGS